MKNILTYKGYSARVYYDPEDKVLPPEVHAALARLGASKGVSLNTMVSEILTREVEKKEPRHEQQQ